MESNASMKFTYYGTAAAEGWPALYCDCPNCEAARAVRGKSLRTRSQSLVNDDLLIDFPADTYLHVLNHGLNLRKVDDLIITHNHEDHFYPDDLFMRIPPFGYLAAPRPLNIFANDSVIDVMSARIDAWHNSAEHFKLHRLATFAPVTVGKYIVHPMAADHAREQTCLFFIIVEMQTGKTILYAHDTGYFFEKNWDYIEKNKFKFDFISLDCTHQTDPQRENHMGLPICVEVRERLADMGAISGSTVQVLNHFSHNGKCKTHDELMSICEKSGFGVAFDGMELEL